MSTTMIERFDREGSDLHIYQVVTDMHRKAPPSRADHV